MQQCAPGLIMLIWDYGTNLFKNATEISNEALNRATSGTGGMRIRP